MKISICIPAYNQANYIEEAVRSAAGQTVKPFEIIVSDDCSTDNTVAILERLQSEIPNLTILKQTENLGIAKNTDACLRCASGDFIVRLDSDDFLSNRFCETLSSLLNQFPSAGYAHAAVQEIDENGNHRKIRRLHRNLGFENNLHALKAAVKGYRVAANIVMFKKDALVTVGYLTGRPEYVEDYHLSVALASAGYGNVYTDEILSYYRVWTDAGKARLKRKLAEIVGLRKVFEEGLVPAFAQRSWQKKILAKSRQHLACTHAECLGWPVYNHSEKEELQIELFKLSSTGKVKLYSKLYRKGLGKPIRGFKQFTRFIKEKIKAAMA